MRKPIRLEIRFLRFLAKPLLIVLIAGLAHFAGQAQTVTIDGCICLSNQTYPGNGQFQADITFSGFSPGETWYIAENEAVGIYHMASLAPPSNPIEFTTGPAGYIMPETSPGVYEFSGKHIDGLGFSITFTNGGPNSTDSLTYVLAQGNCEYPNPQITGDPFVCEEGTSIYDVNPTGGSTYSWSLATGGTFLTPTDGTQVEVEWEADNPGPHDLTVTESAANGCVVSDVMQVTLEDTIALACNNMVQVSLNSNCEGNLTADMFLEAPQFDNDSYELILETLDGVLLPGNTITSDYIGDTIVVTVRHLCSGNMCWSYMTVEDKIDPEMNCVVDTVRCDESYAPEDIGFPVAYLTPPVKIGPRKYTVQGPDLCGPLTLDYHDDTIQNSCLNEFASFVIRQWVATDGAGNSSVCFDTIKTTRTGLADLIFPPNWDGLPGHNPALTACDDWPKLWNGNPDPIYTGYPEGPLCGNLEIDFSDIELPICGENSYKVIRKWFVMDWCTSEVFDTNQIIAIMDNDPPIVTITKDIEVTTDNYTCSATVDLPGPSVLYECNSWEYTVGYKLADEFGNPPPDNEPYLTDSRVRNNPDGSYTLLDLPLGQTWVKYTITDACNNSTESFFEVLVVDSLPPTAVCDEHTVVSLNDDGIGYAAAIAFDDGSWDNCSEVTFKVRRFENDCGVANGVWLDGLEFCCADVGQDVMIELQVKDASGFTNTCMAFVEVQDKRGPQMYCPPDIDVSCEFFISDYSIFGTVVTDPALAEEIVINDPGNPYTSGDYIWGTDGVASDNCDVTVEIIYEGEIIDECGEGTITRIFEATDGQGNSTQCTQLIRVIDFDPFYINEFNPFDSRDDIKWPRDYVVYGCLDSDTDPEALPFGFDEPEILDDECSLIAYDYDDVVFQYVDGYCYKIVRTWTVIDWCQFEQTNPFGGGRWQYNQIIMVVDDEYPTFTSGCESTPLVNQLNDDGCSATVTLSTSATDNCTDPVDLRWYYEIDVDNDGSVEFTGEDNEVVGTYAYGEHSITWYVEDECGNVSECEKIFIVEDHKKPTPICYEGIVTVPMPTTGTVEVFAKSFNICNGCEAGSYDNCTPQDELVFSFSEDINDVSRIFTCDDIENGILDTIEIEMWVTDLAGNQEYCNTHLILQDNQDICPDAAPIVFDIAGMVMTPDDQLMEGVNVSLHSNDPEFPLLSVSGNNGIYSFNDVNAFTNYQIVAESTDDPMGGISTLDLVFIQKHLLGLKTLDNAYELIAADVNGSGSISAADLLDLRKLILGVNEELPNNQSWEFVQAEEDYASNTNPFPLQEDIIIDGLRFHSLHNNFVGIKVGDVNQSLDFNGDLDIESRSSEVTVLKGTEVEFESGEQVVMSIELSDHLSPEGIQFELRYDANVLSFVNVADQGIGLNQTNYHVTDGYEGLIRISWNSLGEELEGTKLMHFTFKSLKDGKLSETIDLESERLNPEIYYNDGEHYQTKNLELRFEDMEVISDKMILFQNMPNPFAQETRINYYLPMENDIVLKVYDVDGKTVYEQQSNAVLGHGYFTINAEELSLNEGIYYYSIMAGEEISTRKMILIR